MIRDEAEEFAKPEEKRKEKAAGEFLAAK